MADDMALRPQHDSLNFISLCTGGGGLDRAVELAIPSARPILCVEREAFAVANLVAQMQRGLMAPAPIHGDVRTVPGRRFRGGVDGVIGGIPCQPYSLAGKRLGREDERDLWAPARRIFVQSGAWFILIENVGGMLSEGGAERVRGDLLRLGCKVEGGLFRASEVGASHERERLFILGVADRDSQHGHRRGVFRAGWRGQFADGRHGLADASGARLQGCGSDHNRSRKRSSPERGGSALADASSHSDQRRGGPRELLCEAGPPEGLGQEWQRGRDTSDSCGSVVVDAAGDGRGEGRAQSELRRGGRSTSVPDNELVDAFSGGRNGWPCEPQRSPEERAAVEWAGQGPLFAPGPSDAASWSAIAQQHPERLPAVSRYDLFRVACRKAGVDPDEHQGPRQEVGARQAKTLRAAILQEVAQSTLRRGSDGLAPRIDQLRMLGNGVVDLEGAYALRTLATDLARRSAGAALLVRMMGEQG